MFELYSLIYSPSKIIDWQEICTPSAEYSLETKLMTVFTNNAGNDTFHGIAGEYDQVDYLQPLSEFSFTRNADGSVTVFHPTVGTDTLFDIDGIWSIADNSWYSIEDAIALTPNSTENSPEPVPTVGWKTVTLPSAFRVIVNSDKE